ncbi:MAG: tetratricopeptide repeat protein [Deferribacterales bacterium]
MLRLLISVFLIFTLQYAFAETKTYTKTVRKIIGTSQSADDAKIFAIADAKRSIIEEAGTFIKSYTSVENGVIKQDELEAAAAGLLSTRITKVSNLVENGVFIIEVTVEASVETDNLKENAEKIINNSILISQYDALQKKLDEQLENNRILEQKAIKLEQELMRTTDDAKKQNLTQEQKALSRNNNKSANIIKATEYAYEAAKLITGEGAGPDDFQTALDYSNKALNLDPELSDAYFLRAVIYESSLLTDKAIEDYKSALEYDPEHDMALRQLVLIYGIDRHDYKTVLDLIDQLLIKRPVSKILHQYKAQALYMSGNHNAAVTELTAISKLYPNDTYTLLTLAVYHMDSGNNESAVATLTSLLKQKPDNIQALLLRSQAYEAMGNTQLMCADAQAACRLKNCEWLNELKEKGFCK